MRHIQAGNRIPTDVRNLTDGPKSLVVDNGRPANAEIESGDSSRAGQLFQGAAYAGLKFTVLGTLTFGRQNGLILDDLIKYDPQAQSQAFSPIGYSGVARGGGDTEDTRLDWSLKYIYAFGSGRVAILHQFSDDFNSGGADEIDLGATTLGFRSTPFTVMCATQSPPHP